MNLFKYYLSMVLVLCTLLPSTSHAISFSRYFNCFKRNHPEKEVVTTVASVAAISAPFSDRTPPVSSHKPVPVRRGLKRKPIKQLVEVYGEDQRKRIESFYDETYALSHPDDKKLRDAVRERNRN